MKLIPCIFSARKKLLYPRLLLHQVYLDEADKPAVGEGLNKAAEVTLHKVGCPFG